MARRRPSSIRKRSRPKLTDDEWRYFFDREPENRFLRFTLGRGRGASLWEEAREKVLKWWIEARPGTRPSAWWRSDAPRMPKQWLGAPEWLLQQVANAPEPRAWINGKRYSAVWAGGVPHFRHGALWGEDYAAELFESQASYLKRHELLAKGEEARVPQKNWDAVPGAEASSR